MMTFVWCVMAQMRAVAVVVVLLSLAACGSTGTTTPATTPGSGARRRGGGLAAAVPSLNEASFDAGAALHDAWLLAFTRPECGGHEELARALGGAAPRLVERGVRVGVVDAVAAPGLARRVGARAGACGELCLVAGGRVYAWPAVADAAAAGLEAFALGGYRNSGPGAPLPALGESLRPPVGDAPFEGSRVSVLDPRALPALLQGDGGGDALLFLYAAWSTASAVAVPIVRAAAEALWGGGAVVRAVDAGAESNLARRLRVPKVPALVRVSNGSVCYYNAGWSAEGLAAFARDRTGAGSPGCSRIDEPPVGASPWSPFVVLGDAGASDFSHGIAPTSIVVFGSAHCAAPGGLASRHWHTLADVLWPDTAVYVVDVEAAPAAVERFNVDILPGIIFIRHGSVFLYSPACERGGVGALDGVQGLVEFVQRDYEACPWEALPPQAHVGLSISFASVKGERSHLITLGDGNWTQLCGVARPVLVLACSSSPACGTARAAMDAASHTWFPFISAVVVNVEAAPQLALRLNVTVLPHLALLIDGAPVARVEGVELSLGVIVHMLEGAGIRDRVGRAAQAAVAAVTGEATEVQAGSHAGELVSADVLRLWDDAATGDCERGLWLLAFEVLCDGCAPSADLQVLAEASSGILRVASVSCVHNPATIERWGVVACPEVVVLENGKLLASRHGAWTASVLLDMAGVHKH